MDYKEAVRKALEESIGKIEDKVEYLNHGGCGWFVHYVLKEFERYIVPVEDYWVAYLVGWGFNSGMEIEFNLKNRSGKRSSSHLMIKFDGRYYDGNYSGDTYDLDYWYNETEYLVRTNADDMRAACENKYDWNRTYKPERYNKVLRSIIYNSFRKYLHDGNNKTTVQG